MTESCEDIIILSDDDVKIESVIAPKRSKSTNSNNKSSSTRLNSTSIRHRAPILVLTEPKSITYGIERGYKLKQIHGMKRLNSTDELLYLIEYDLCDDYEFVPSNILRQYCDENLLVEYLEKLTQFSD
ncbi:hypothetical protein I4U23_018048 [Adineta vaga]|nr:hypothetical protein I4U23_018048 [Adineta vaga]